MNKTRLSCAFILGLVACSAPAEEASVSESPLTSNTSGYTELGGCTPLGTAPHFGLAEYESRFACEGMGEFGLIEETTELTGDVVIKTSDGEHRLSSLPGTPYLGAGSLSGKAEWRGTYAAPGKTNPKALIFGHRNMDWDGTPTGASLVVAKLGIEASCIYAVIDAHQANANQIARDEADRSDSITCPTETPRPNEPAACGAIPAGTGLFGGQTFPSCNGKYNLVMQWDGNLVLYGDRALWASNTQYHGFAAMLRPDGNFVVWGSIRDQFWASQTQGAGATAWVQDDGNFVIYAADGRVLWSSNTVQP